MNISIIGLDMIGGALGLALGTLDDTALASGRPTITGWDRNSRAVRDARDRLQIDRAARDVAEAVHDADVVFVTGTPDEVGAVFRDIAPELSHGTIVSDVSSVKGQTLALAQSSLPTTIDFIGGHPLVHRSGNLRDASIDFFRGAIYCLTPSPTARPTAIDTLAALVEAIGAKPYYIDAAEHDAYIANTQHLPLVLSAALMESVTRSGGWREMQALAGEPFRLATQLTTLDPAASSAVCANNSAALGGRIDELIQLLIELRDNLHNREQLEAIFVQARDAHQQWQAAQPNMRPGEAAFYGDTEDPTVNRGLGALFFGQRKRPNQGKK